MANYIARVELHAATDDDYEVLHDAMEHRGYARTIMGSDNRTYHLPTGTYVMRDAMCSLEEALNRAAAAAKETGKTSSIIVTDWNAARWIGLKAV